MSPCSTVLKPMNYRSSHLSTTHIPVVLYILYKLETCHPRSSNRIQLLARSIRKEHKNATDSTKERAIYQIKGYLHHSLDREWRQTEPPMRWRERILQQVPRIGLYRLSITIDHDHDHDSDQMSCSYSLLFFQPKLLHITRLYGAPIPLSLLFFLMILGFLMGGKMAKCTIRISFSTKRN